ncbi:MAG: S41 family peptidase [Myxococcota bacterium]
MSAFSRMLWHWLLPAALLLGCNRATAPAPPAAPVAARAHAVDPVDALQAFARVFGYVRYFHPTDAAADANWSELAAQGSAWVADAETLGELAERLQSFFEPIAPTLEIWVEGEPPPGPRGTSKTSYTELVYWQYLGYPGAVLSLYSPPYSKVRVGAERRGRRFSQMPARDAVADDEILPGLFARVPVTLHQDEAAAAKPGARARGLDEALGRRATSSKSFTDLHVRRAAVIEIWNVLRHFYPYQGEVAVDWDGELRRALSEVEEAELPQVVVALQDLVHALRDGHGEVGHRRLPTRASLPFSLRLVEGHAVVAATEQPERFAVGDVVLTIGEDDAVDRIGWHAARLSGSPQWREFKAAAWEAPKGPKGQSVVVKLRRGSDEHVVTTTFGAPEPAEPPRPEPVFRYPDGVWYVDLTRAEWEAVEPKLPEIAAAPGVVFDMRGYPTDTHRIIDHLIDVSEDALWMHVPAIVEPNGDVAGWHALGWHRKPAEPHIEGKVAFLTGPGAISYGESVVGYVEEHQLGTRVGAPTAGANGDIVRFDAAGGFFVIFTGMRVTRHDGTSFHCVGLQPELPIAPTLRGLAAGRDEVLEVGLGVARGRIDPSTPPTRTAAP